MMKNCFPRRCCLPVVGTVLINILAFYGTRLIPGRQYVSIVLPLDQQIPFVPAMVFIYVLAFASWALGAWLVSRDTEERYCRLFFAEQLATFICLLFFAFMPTNMIRPELPESGSLAVTVLGFIYRVDSPDNLFPSLHCVENWILFRALLGNRRIPGWVKAGYGIFALLVFASVLMVKQHLFLDVIGAVTVVELSLVIARVTRAERFYLSLNRRLFD